MSRNEYFESEKNDGRKGAPLQDLSEQMLVALRRVMRAVDLHSRKLMQSHGLTGPQALVLQEVVKGVGLSAGELASRVSLSQATVTDILNRLEQRGLLTRERSESDRRKVAVRPTLAGGEVIAAAPPLLQETFVRRFGDLKPWEQMLLLSSLQRIAELMDAERLDAAPLLTGGALEQDTAGDA
jgi:DNA-binding MarR family transcriptional regulator